MLKKCFLSIVLFSFYSLAHANIPISSCADLRSISSNMSGYYYLTRDIISCGTVHPLDGTFTGTLDGQGFTISNMTLVNQDGRRSENIGIFRAIGQNAHIKHINFHHTVLTAHPDAHRGVIAGVSTGDVHVTDVTFDQLQILHYDVPPDKKKDLGGTGSVVGFAQDGTLTLQSIVLKGTPGSVEIAQNAFAGGLVGIAQSNVVIEKASILTLASRGSKTCYNPANECGYGGFIGLIGHPELHNNGNNPPDTHSPVLPDGYSVIISQSFVRGSIFSDKNMGGMVGMIKPNRAVLIENSFSDVAILCRDNNPRTGECGNAGRYAGGIVGKAVESSTQKMITLANVFVIGRVQIPRDYSDGTFLYPLHSAAIVGIKPGEPSTRFNNLPNTQSYFDKTTTTKGYSGDQVSIGLTTEQMQAGFTTPFETWDPAIWTFALGYYPILK